MEQSLYLLLGAGVFIAILSFFIKNPVASLTDKKTALVQKQQDRAEMEKTLQRFVQQVKKENEQVISGLHRNNQLLQSKVDSIQEKLIQVELEQAEMRLAVSSFEPNLSAQEIEPEEKNEDALMLKERYHRVFELKNEGLQVDEIAKRLGAGQGEIELIFSLASPAQRGTTHG